MLWELIVEIYISRVAVLDGLLDMVYGPLLRKATTLIYEGKPNTPDPGLTG
jgi:acyl-coenzyme A synthetase/AMP-(fatty) acid ligase